MRSTRCVGYLLSVVAFVVVGSHTVEAAQITSIKYDVTGGTRSFERGGTPYASIAGGSVTYISPTPFLSTPITCLTSCPGSLIVRLEMMYSPPFLGTSSRAYSLLGYAGATVPHLVVGQDVMSFRGLNGGPCGFAGCSLFLANDFLLQYNDLVKYGFVYHVEGSATTYYFSFTVGNEVRTLVPEPSTATLLALGLGLMGVAGSGAGWARRARRAHR